MDRKLDVQWVLLMANLSVEMRVALMVVLKVVMMAALTVGSWASWLVVMKAA